MIVSHFNTFHVCFGVLMLICLRFLTSWLCRINIKLQSPYIQHSVCVLRFTVLILTFSSTQLNWADWNEGILRDGVDFSQFLFTAYHIPALIFIDFFVDITERTVSLSDDSEVCHLNLNFIRIIRLISDIDTVYELWEVCNRKFMQRNSKFRILDYSLGLLSAQRLVLRKWWRSTSQFLCGWKPKNNLTIQKCKFFKVIPLNVFTTTLKWFTYQKTLDILDILLDIV